MTAFVDWIDTFEGQTSNKFSFLGKSDCDGWWSCLGKCVAGTLGGAIIWSVTLSFSGNLTYCKLIL